MILTPKQFYLKNHLDLNINILEGRDVNNMLGIILNVHGVGSHFQKVYDSLDEFDRRDELFSKFNYKSFAFEFHGHGKSEGKRCFINNFDDLLEDLDIVIKYIQKRFTQPLYLFCESMGCAVAFKYCIVKKNNIQGVIFTAPLCGISSKLKPNIIIRTLLLKLANLLPTLPLVTTTRNMGAQSTLNQDYVEAKNNNDFFYKKSHRLATCRELVSISEWIESNCYLFNTPILMFHGKEDNITEYSNTIKVFDTIQSQKKELYLIENGYHILLIDNIKNSFLPEYIMIKSVKWLLNNKKN